MTTIIAVSPLLPRRQARKPWRLSALPITGVPGVVFA
jgi:hypothetical protein